MKTPQFGELYSSSQSSRTYPAGGTIGGHLRLVADFDQATTTFIDYTDTLTA